MKNLRTLLTGTFVVALVCAAGETHATRAVPSDSPQIVTLPVVKFPLQMLHRGITTGEVHLVLKISPDAVLQDTLVTAYTNKVFADTAVDALQYGKFRPLLVDGQPVTTITSLVVRFETNGIVFVERNAVDTMDLQLNRFAYEPCAPGRLDRPLQPIATARPPYPIELDHQGARGRVVIDYYVDETGRVRMPVVDESENPTLASLSLAAVEQWQFNPPLSRNKPVLVRVRQKFEFVPEVKS